MPEHGFYSRERERDTIYDLRSKSRLAKHSEPFSLWWCLFSPFIIQVRETTVTCLIYVLIFPKSYNVTHNDTQQHFTRRQLFISLFEKSFTRRTTLHTLPILIHYCCPAIEWSSGLHYDATRYRAASSGAGRGGDSSPPTTLAFMEAPELLLQIWGGRRK